MTRFDGNESLERRAHKFIRLMVMLVVGLAFFFRNSALDRTVAFYPGPAGATESELDLKAWNEQGELIKDEQYSSGELHGQCRYYSDAGDLLRETSVASQASPMTPRGQDQSAEEWG